MEKKFYLKNSPNISTGRIKVDEKIRKTIPEFSPASPFTWYHMCNHGHLGNV